MNNIAQSNPEGELERLGGVRSNRESEHEGLEKEAARSGAGGVEGDFDKNVKPKTQRKSQKKGKKWPIVVLIVVALAVIGGGVAWWLLEGRKDESSEVEEIEEQVPVKEEQTSGSGSVEEVTAGEIVDMDINSELVQKLYGHFDSSFFAEMYNAHVVLGEIYPSDKLSVRDMTTLQKVVIALQNLGFYADGANECEGDYSWFHWEGEDVDEGDTAVKMCFSGERVRAKIGEIFGDDAIDFSVIKMSDGEAILVDGEGWIYDAENDEFVHRASGATRRPIYRALLKATQDAERIYLYDIAGYVGCWMAGQIESGEVCLAAKIDGTEIEGSAGVTSENMKDYADLFDEYKWTFVKDGNGGYVFEQVERIR